jgi:hypothetical protein
MDTLGPMQKNCKIGYAGFSHLRSRAALYIASMTLTRAAASRGLTSGWSFCPATALTNWSSGAGGADGRWV